MDPSRFQRTVDALREANAVNNVAPIIAALEDLSRATYRDYVRILNAHDDFNLLTLCMLVGELREGTKGAPTNLSIEGLRGAGQYDRCNQQIMSGTALPDLLLRESITRFGVTTEAIHEPHPFALFRCPFRT